MSEKIYRVQMNSSGMPNFSTAVEIADRPQGEWKRRLVDNGFNADWICSECGYRVKTDFVSFNFCPHCGARMKGANDGTD